MDIFLFNASWMAFNMYLAILPAFFSMYLFKLPYKIATLIVGFFWFIYLPNTIYVFTDLHHLVEQWSMVEASEKVLLIFQYSILEATGLICFLFAFYPFETILSNLKFNKEKRIFILVFINFLMGFAMSFGKFERVNSWDVFINPQLVFTTTLHFLSSFELIGLGILFGLFTNFFYFLFRKQAKNLYSRLQQFDK